MKKRIIVALSGSVIISLGMFFLMQQMISSDANLADNNKAPIELSYLMDKKDSEVEKKSRIIPKEPIQKIEPKKMDIKINLNQKINHNVKIKSLAINRDIDLSSIASLNGAQIDVRSSLIDANILIALKRVNPRYPRMAKRQKTEGFVQLVFRIDSQGYVSNVKVVDANPKGVFEKSSVSAIQRWRFKPSKNDVEGSFKEATITFNFKVLK